MDSETWIAGASFVVSACAFVMSWNAESRGRTAARTQMFLDLRTRFLDVLEKLPPRYREPDWLATDPEERAAAIRYWHNAFDEWYVTRRLNDRLMRQLWDGFYSTALVAGLGHTGLRKTLIEMAGKDVPLAELWSDFRCELDALWARRHPQDGSRCKGIECDHRLVSIAPGPDAEA